MKLIPLLFVVVLIIAACTQTSPEPLPEKTTEPVQPVEQPDDYVDIQTAQNDFDVIEETLDLLT